MNKFEMETLKRLLRQVPFLYHALQKIGRSIHRGMILVLGLGYEKRIITDGPLRGLRFLAAKRVCYSEKFWDGTFEKEMCIFLKKATKPHMICYDIGANIGYHALVMAGAAEKGHVYAFEPIPHVCKILQENIDINHDRHNVTIIQKVVADMEGTIQLGLDPSIDQAALKFARKDESHRMCKILEFDAITLDAFVTGGYKPPSLIKIDVEGAEIAVLRGARQVLAQYHPLIICETHGRVAARGVYEILHEHGYEIFIVHDGVRSILSPGDMPDNMDEGHVFARPLPLAIHQQTSKPIPH